LIKIFYDGARSNGYGGFSYNSRFWESVVPSFQKHGSLGTNNSILDIGCAKGFMICDMQRLIPGLKVFGIDISKYAIENAKE
jgi:2-polyprenyl-3-methyl-5-hydroxy-6-metoxy-1,4-benzoquinol methylase